MTMFVGYINDPAYLLPILDNFIIEGARTNEVQKSWRFLYAAITALLYQQGPQLLEMNDMGYVAMHFQKMQAAQKWGFEPGGPQDFFKMVMAYIPKI